MIVKKGVPYDKWTKVDNRIIEDLSGDKLNESSIKAAVSEISKNNLEKNLW